jgi:Family of unknown function (DUF5761)
MTSQQQVPEFHVSMFEGSKRLDQNQMILDAVKRDKQVPGVIPSDLSPPVQYKLTDSNGDVQIAERNASHLFKNLFGNTLLTDMFFSKKNVQNVQNLIKFLVHREIGEVIDNQSYKELLIVMRGVFLEYHAHPLLLNEKMSKTERARVIKMYTAEVSRLNEIVLNIVVPRIVSQLQQYKHYLRDASAAPSFFEVPSNESTAGQREYRSITQVLLGGDL